VQDARFYHPTFRLNRRGEWLPTICRLGRSNGSNVIGRIRKLVSGSLGSPSAPADKSEFKPGAKIFISAANKKEDGTLEAPTISVGRDGITPPM
jgi:hypothetical protein